MFGRFALISLLALALSCWFAAAVAQQPPPAANEEILVLRSGEVLSGRISRDGNRYRVTLADGELGIRDSDVELVCHNLDEAYDAKHNRLGVGRADDHLDLAEWCLRQNLPGYAAREISIALALDPNSRRIELLDRRLQQSLSPPPAVAKSDGSQAAQISNEDLDRMVRGMPTGSVEAFTATIQPLLINSCATSGCHGPGSKSNFNIIRIPTDRFANRRLTQRNLQNTIQLLDFQNPQQSRLLAAASRPHGSSATAIIDPQSVKYRQLLTWIGLVTQRVPGQPDPSEPPPTVGHTGFGPLDSHAADQFPATAAADNDTRPTKSIYKSRLAKIAAARAELEAAEKEGEPPQTSVEQPHPTPPAAPPPASDPYDADQFNRQYANPPPKSTPDPKTGPDK